MPHDAATQDFLAGLMRAYYSSRPALHVARPANREWMMMDLQGTTTRFLAFAGAEDLARAAALRVPAHLYHSLAHYHDPSQAHNIAGLDKQRMATEVLLDIDCKPGPPPKGDGYATLDDALAAARGQAQQVCDMLVEDFAVHETEMSLAFTGSKGYRIILDSSRFCNLSRRARTELACALTASGARLDCYFPGTTSQSIHLPRQTPVGGSARRLHAGLRRLEGMARMSPPPRTLLQLLERHNTTAADSTFILGAIAASGLEAVLNREPGLQDLVTKVARGLALPRLDMGVVANLSGLCRLAGSLNAKTGLQCRSIPLSGLASFDPYVDANPHPRHRSIEVCGLADRGLQIRGEEFRVHRDRIANLPLNAAAIFLFSSSARLAGAPRGQPL